MKEHFKMMAAYNTWAHDRVYTVSEQLDPEDFSRDTGAFFRSMQGTLNHLLVADRIWMRRFTGEGPNHTRLDDVPFPEFEALRGERIALDRRIGEWIDGADADSLTGTFTYTPVSASKPVTQKLTPALTHLFNHQTHHRGHAHMILSVLGKDPPPLDLIYFQRTDEGRAFA